MVDHSSSSMLIPCGAIRVRINHQDQAQAQAQAQEGLG